MISSASENSPRGPLRVALFTDSFDEANGVATLSREFTEFAARRKYPFFCVHGGPANTLTRRQTVTTMQLKRGFASFPLDRELYCDPLLSRYRNKVLAQIRLFQPDLVHITGPGDIGIMGLWMQHLLHVPLIASWHTNLHEYAGRRLHQSFAFLPQAWRQRISDAAERQSLRACMWFYHYGRFTLAPNQPMVNVLRQWTHRPSYLMAHGVNTEQFSLPPAGGPRRPFCIGYVGRLTPEKNVRFLAELEQRLLAAGERDFRFLLVGEGSEREWLRRRMQFAALPGILRGPALARAFADMDAFVFPSQTDTFGLVLLEAMATGVPVVVSPTVGTRVNIEHGVTGFHAGDPSAFTQTVLRLMHDDALRRRLGCAAREFARSRGWDQVFERLYQTYDAGLDEIGLSRSQHPLARAEIT